MCDRKFPNSHIIEQLKKDNAYLESQLVDAKLAWTDEYKLVTALQNEHRSIEEKLASIHKIATARQILYPMSSALDEMLQKIILLSEPTELQS